jgi:hypothetical protein
MSSTPAFYNELNTIKAYGTTNKIIIQLVMQVVTGYVPTGDPISESLMYIACLAYQNLKSTFTTAQQNEVNKWILALGTAEMNFVNTNSSTSNNWLAHQIKTVAIAGDVIGNTTFLNWANTNILKYISLNLYSDATCIDFKQRDSITYVTYSLNALVLAILALKKHFKINYYTYTSIEGASIKNCIYWLKPYIEGSKVNLMFLNSIYASDKVIHANQYGLPWPKSDAQQLFINASTLDSTLTDYYNQHLN